MELEKKIFEISKAVVNELMNEVVRGSEKHFFTITINESLTGIVYLHSKDRIKAIESHTGNNQSLQKWIDTMSKEYTIKEVFGKKYLPVNDDNNVYNEFCNH